MYLSKSKTDLELPLEDSESSSNHSSEDEDSVPDAVPQIYSVSLTKSKANSWVSKFNSPISGYDEEQEPLL
jgi:hypothetical protein